MGIDENGLGPRLGPLVVTAAWASATDEGAQLAHGLARAANGRKLRWPGANRLGDSKKLVGFGDSGLGEAWARALARRRGETPASPEDLVRSLSIDDDVVLRARCPDDHVGQCWGSTHERFEADEVLVDKVERDLRKLEARGVHLRGARVAIVCTERLNDAAARGTSRFDVDLHAMERLAIALRAEAGADVTVTCGKVGGIDRYGARFGPLSGHLHTMLEEGRARSEYRVAGLGRIAFVRDADDAQMLVCMASLIGKWVRDLLMNRIVRYHRDHQPELPVASGYHDPVTARFVAASALARQTRALPDVCFERTRAARDEDIVVGAT